jgi:hypothetical protein
MSSKVQEIFKVSVTKEFQIQVGHVIDLEELMDADIIFFEVKLYADHSPHVKVTKAERRIDLPHILRVWYDAKCLKKHKGPCGVTDTCGPLQNTVDLIIGQPPPPTTTRIVSAAATAPACLPIPIHKLSRADW